MDVSMAALEQLFPMRHFISHSRTTTVGEIFSLQMPQNCVKVNTFIFCCMCLLVNNIQKLTRIIGMGFPVLGINFFSLDC